MAFLGPQSGANCLSLIKSTVCLGGAALIIGDKSDKSPLKWQSQDASVFPYGGINWLITARNSLNSETEREGGGLSCTESQAAGVRVARQAGPARVRTVGGGPDIWGRSVAIGCVWLCDLVLAMQKQKRGQPKKLQWTEQCFTVVPCKGFISIMGLAPAAVSGSLHQAELQHRKPIPWCYNKWKKPQITVKCFA